MMQKVACPTCDGAGCVVETISREVWVPEYDANGEPDLERGYYDREPCPEQALCSTCAGDGSVYVVPAPYFEYLRNERDALEIRVSGLEPALAFIWSTMTPEDREAVYSACPPVGQTAMALAALAAAVGEVRDE